MLQIRNNDIELTRGENAQIAFSAWTKDGKPYIMPPLPEDMWPVIAFTVRSGAYDSVIFALYFNMKSNPVINGQTDYGGWTKYTSQVIKETGKTTLDLSTAQADLPEHFVYHSVTSEGVDIYQQGLTNESGEIVDIVPYEFNFTIPIDHDVTKDIEAKDYIYDLILYYGIPREGILDPKLEGFPLENIIYKKELIAPHKFTIGDTNNA